LFAGIAVSLPRNRQKPGFSAAAGLLRSPVQTVLRTLNTTAEAGFVAVSRLHHIAITATIPQLNLRQQSLF
jgi:hypothetical protein